MRMGNGIGFAVQTIRYAALMAALIFCVVQSGCGNNSPLPTAKVSGTIKTEDGTPLKNGRILFGPINSNSEGLSGKAASGEIKDGKFVLTTYNRGDGAIVGKHRVALRELADFDEELMEEFDLPPKHGCKISPEFAEVEVVAGKNVFELIAIPKSQEDADD